MIPMFDSVPVSGTVGEVIKLAPLLGGLVLGVLAVLTCMIARYAGEAMRRQAVRDGDTERADPFGTRARLAA